MLLVLGIFSNQTRGTCPYPPASDLLGGTTAILPSRQHVHGKQQISGHGQVSNIGALIITYTSMGGLLFTSIE